MKDTLRWLASNSALMLLAFLLAALAWVVAIEREDPTLQEPYPQELPVTLPDPPEGMIVVGEFDERVQVTVRAPQSVWETLEPDDFSVRVNLDDLGPGSHQVPIQVTLSKSPSRIVAYKPERVALELEHRIERDIPVRVQVNGDPALGYLKRRPVVTPSQVTVVGPGSYVTQVVEAITQVSVQDADSNVEGEFSVQLLDDEDQPVPHVTAIDGQVQVRVPIELSVYYRPLVVKVVLEGQFAPGYRITNISVEPPSVTVFATPDVIAALPGYIETEPIDLEGAQADVVARPALNVPPNVSVVMDEQPVVKVSIESIQSSQTVVVTPELQGLEPDRTAVVSPETVEVILSGPMPLLESLKSNDVRVVLDLFDLPLGTHNVEPQVVVPEGVMAQSIIPSTVQVEIATAPTPTPIKSPPES